MFTGQRILLVSVFCKRWEGEREAAWLGMASSQIVSALDTVMIHLWLIGVSVLLWEKIIVVIFIKTKFGTRMLRGFILEKSCCFQLRLCGGVDGWVRLRKETVRDVSVYPCSSSSHWQRKGELRPIGRVNGAFFPSDTWGWHLLEKSDGESLVYLDA